MIAGDSGCGDFDNTQAGTEECDDAGVTCVSGGT